MPSMWARRRDGSSRRAGLSVRRPRAMLALVATIVTASVVFSGGVGDGALPTASLPAFGVTAGNGSLSTVAELGDINGDGFGDYAIGMPSADVGTSADAGIVYVFLGRAGALPPTPTALNPAAASFQITGRGSEMLGYTIVGNDVNRDGLSDIAIGAPMAGAPSKAGGGAVYVVFGSRTPATLSTNVLSFAGYTNAATRPATPSPLGSRYDGFQQNGHTGMSLAALPDVNGDGYRDLAVGAPDASLHAPGRRRRRRALRQAAGRAHHAQRPLGGRLPVLLPHRLSRDRQPARRDERRERRRHDRRRLARHRGRCAAGRSRRPHRRRLGLDHQRAPPADRGLHEGLARRRLPVDQAPQPLGRAGVPHRRPRRGRTAGHARSPASATRTATASATSRSARPAPRRSGAPAPAPSSSCPGSATR